MLPELGHFALILATGLAIVQGVMPMLGAWRRVPAWIDVAGPAAAGQFVFVALAYLALTGAFIDGDFSVAYVAQNSNERLPFLYKVSAVWGAHEGSILLWSLVLAGWTLAVAFRSAGLTPDFRARVLAVMGLVSVGFYLFILMTSNPFDRLLPAPADGQDLNPLLQDPGMAIHPPLLYMGYVGLAVPFAFAVAALLDGRLDSAWMRWTRPWTTIAWAFLTVGITLGSWWAYNELGWGGWWFWDPVENASFMPWLIATALLHSLAVSEQRGAFRAWTVLLALFGFSLSLLGTFLVRSGVLVSVHAFATDPTRGVFILIFLSLVIGCSLTLYAFRASRVAGGGQFDLFSRETLLLVNNVLLVVASASILLGTLYPLFLDALDLGKISVGPPYFNAVFAPLMLPLTVLMGIGPLTRWKSDRVGRLARLTGPAFAVCAALGLTYAAIHLSPRWWLVAASLASAAWITFTCILGVRERIRHRSDRTHALGTLPRAFVGMTIAHLGVAVFIVGVTFTSTFGTEKDVRLLPGESVELSGYRFRLDGVVKVDGPNYVAERASVQVFDGDDPLGELLPEKRLYPIQAQPMTEAAIDIGFTRDLYVALGERFDDGAWSLRVHHKPFVRWIWLGPLLMALGGVLAALDRRYRKSARVHPEAARVDGAGAVAGA